MKLLHEQHMQIFNEKEYGVIFSIQRFSIHDGKGIRTTVFFKGCPLRCLWCHNPEGLNFKPRLVFTKSKCIYCDLCTLASNGAISFEDKDIKIDYSIDFNQEEIEDVCPTNALLRDSKVWHVDDLVKEVLKDKAFFKYGGGVTISGGESLAQSRFAGLFLKKIQSYGIHTAIETSLFATRENLDRVLDHLDQIYFDLKLYDEEKHKKYIGSRNKIILENAKYILSGPHASKVTVRTPIITGITDSDENIAAIASFISGLYPEVKYELLNYNVLAPEKYSKVGLKYKLSELKPKSDKEMNRLIRIARDNGVKNIINEVR